MRVLLTGGTGLVGRAVAERFPEVTLLTRDPSRAATILPGARAFAWSPPAEAPPAAAFDGVDAVVHLAGDPIGAGRWSGAKKARLRASRVDATRQLVTAMSRLAHPPRLLVSASAMGYYGDRGDEVLTEVSAPGTGFLAELARDWEAEAEAARAFGARVVRLRIALVLARGGGALEKLVPVFRLGLGGRLGSGRQWMSWIHRDDLADLVARAVADPSLEGAVNASSPEPARNAEFTRVLARTVRRPAIFPAPAAILRLVLGEFADSLLASQRMAPAVARQAGFAFRYPTLAPALAEILG